MHSKADELLLIDTPENVVFGYDVAGIGSRFLAALVDTAIISGLVILVLITASLVLSMLNTLDEIILGGDRAVGIVLAIASFLAFAFFWGYYVFFELLWNGQSPGKRLVGLRVIGTNGQPVGITEAVLRNLVRIIDLLPGTYGIGVITMFLNDRSRRLGDFAAGTLVVYDRGTVSLDMLQRSQQNRQFLRPSSVILAQVADLPVDRLDEEDIVLTESFLERHYYLRNQAVLAKQLTDMLFRKMDLQPRPVLSSAVIDFLEAIVYQSRAEPQELPPNSVSAGSG